jgi:predicted SprT family Zn-dependent metalloprotease
MRKSNPGQLEFDFQPAPVKVHRQEGSRTPVKQPRSHPSPQKYDKRNTLKMGEKLQIRLVEELFAQSIPGPFQIQFHNNRSTVMSIRDHEGVLRFRLQRFFLHAPQEVLKAVAGLVRRKTAKREKLIREFIKEQTSTNEWAASAKPRRVNLPTKGTVYDLRAIFDRLNEQYFEGKVQARIGWGPRRSTRGKSRIRLGSYQPEQVVIRIHPVLDQAQVPWYVIEDTVFHEMAHAFVGIHQERGRNRAHTPEFWRVAKKFTHHVRAEAWERLHLQKIFRRWRP